MAVLLVLLFLALRFTHRWYSLYVVLAIGVWAAMLASGVHATVAGILVALTIPVRARIEPDEFLEAIRGKAAWLQQASLTPGEHGPRPGADGRHRGHRHGHARLPPGRLRAGALPPPGDRLRASCPSSRSSTPGSGSTGRLGEALLQPVSLGIVLGLFFGKRWGSP